MSIAELDPLSPERLMKKAKATTRPYNRTDIGNAERLADLYGHRLRFRYEKRGGVWHAWDGQRWALDKRGEVERCAKETVADIFNEAALLEGDERAAHARWGMSSQNVNRLEAMTKAARSDERIVIELSDLDCNPWELNVENGIVDLWTGELRPHDPAAMHSKMVRASLHEEDWQTAAPTWARFMEQVLPDPDLRDYVQRLAGYSIAGDVGENILAFPYGSGANGKSVFLGVLSEVLSDYATPAAPDLLVARRERGIPADIADLRGYRFVVTTEVESGRAMATDVMKRLTGEQRLKARLLYGNYEEWDNVSTLWMAANDYPRVDGLDEAIWRRIKTIPFTVTIPKEDRDPALHTKLLQERDGILRWLIDGIVSYHDGGLQDEPAAVRAATEAYRTESNPLAAFFEDECVRDKSGQVRASDLRDAYDKWAAFNRLRPEEKLPRGKKWAAALEDLGFSTDRRKIDGSQVRCWVGLKLDKASRGSQADTLGGLEV